jgi:hypothetical protein
MLPMFVGWRCFPEHKGLVSSLIFATNGSGAILSSIFSTLIVNPNNESPTITVTKDNLQYNYFDSNVSSNVPILFRYLVYIEMALLVYAIFVIWIPEVPE